jgi:hypothetical protein
VGTGTSSAISSGSRVAKDVTLAVGVAEGKGVADGVQAGEGVRVAEGIRVAEGNGVAVDVDVSVGSGDGAPVADDVSLKAVIVGGGVLEEGCAWATGSGPRRGRHCRTTAIDAPINSRRRKEAVQRFMVMMGAAYVCV